MTPDQLMQLLEKGDGNGVAGVFRGMSEKERRGYAPAALKLLKQAERDHIDSLMGKKTGGKSLSYESAQLVVLATASQSELIAMGRWIQSEAAGVGIMAERKPEWLDEFADQGLAKYSGYWPFVRAMVKAGVCRKPECDNWVIGFIAPSGLRRFDRKTMREIILADEEIRNEILWRLFEVEGNQETSLAQHDKYSKAPYAWSGAIIELAAEGKLPRARLLDATLDALQRDFAQFRAGWFSQLHEALKPTGEERTARIDRYLGLLASRIPPTQSFAVDALLAIAKSGKLPDGASMQLLAPALQAKAKKTAIGALKLLRLSADKTKDMNASSALAATHALCSEHADVQSAAMDLIEKFGAKDDPALRTAITDTASQVSASLRKRLEPWLQSEDAGAPLADDEPAMPAAAPQAILPAADLDEAIRLLTAAIEDFGSGDDFERALDAASRWCHERPADFALKTGPLLKRARHWLKRQRRQHELEAAFQPFSGVNLRLDLCAVAVAWITREEPPPLVDYERGVAFIAGRTREVALRAARGEARGLLALPTHAGGWIAPMELVNRLRATAAADTLDAVQALLRLSPEGRTGALAAAAGLPGDAADALRYALGGTLRGRSHSPSQLLAAARVRNPDGDLDIEGIAGPDGSRGARYRMVYDKHADWDYLYLHVEVTPSPRGDAAPEKALPWSPAEVSFRAPVGHATVALHGDYWAYHTDEKPLVYSMVRCLALIRPGHHEARLAAGMNADSMNGWTDGGWAYAEQLLPLLHPWAALGPVSRAAIAIALNARDAATGKLAAELLIQAITDGRLDAASTGEALASVMALGFVLPPRWAKQLADVARVSSRHAAVIRSAIDRLCADCAAAAPKNFAALLELQVELYASSGIAPAENVRPGLRQLSSAGGRAAQFAKQLLKL